jgi:hypothetical protein
MERALAMDPALVAALNGVLDPGVFTLRQQELEREDMMSSSSSPTPNQDAMYGTSVPLGKAAVTRAMQVRRDSNKFDTSPILSTSLPLPINLFSSSSLPKVYSDPNKGSRKRGLDSMLLYPVGAVARAQRELCWNDWIYYPSSKGRRLGPRRVSWGRWDYSAFI